MRDEFLSERWAEVSKHEHGEHADDGGDAADEFLRQDIYLANIRASVRGHAELEKQLNAVKKAAVDYYRAFNALRSARSEETPDVTKASRSDELRRLTHNRFVDEVNLLSRMFAKAGLDNDWRGFVGSDRREIGNWGLRIARIIVDE